MSRLVLGRVSLRGRITILCGVLSCATAAMLLATTYVLFNQQLSRPGPKVVIGSRPPGGAPAVAAWMEQQRADVHEAATDSLLMYGSLAMAAVTVVGVGIAWLIAGRVLTPLHRVTETARRIVGAPALNYGLQERIRLAGSADEVKELADAFDAMVGRLDRSFAGQRRFVANASHELRTPLAVSRAMVELAMRRDSASSELTRLGTDLLEVNGRLERLIDGLLALASAENSAIEAHPVDMADVASHAATGLAGAARARSVDIQLHLSEAITSGDATLLERLVHNLIENAIKYNSSTSPQVVIATGALPNSKVYLRVSNSGDHIRDDDLPTLFEPFQRLPRQTRTDGVGLGLSIADAITHAHRGTIHATARPEGGISVEVTLPTSPSELTA
jgi:signal transduction histidine kinase